MSHKEEEPLIGPQRNSVAGPIVTIICLVISVASLVLVSVVLHRVYEDVDQGKDKFSTASRIFYL